MSVRPAYPRCSRAFLILLAATWLSDILGMRTIHALLAWMINAGPVLLIVLFQSEIRRILEELGNNSVFDSSALSMREGNTELIIDEMFSRWSIWRAARWVR